MSIYKAHKPICEVRTPYYDCYKQVLWICIDNYEEGATRKIGYDEKRQYVWREREVKMTTILSKAHGMRMKLTNSRQRCKLFMRYRRPTI